MSMIDVSRQSTFPPLLGNSQIGAKVEYTRCSNDIKSLKARHLAATELQERATHKPNKPVGSIAKAPKVTKLPTPLEIHNRMRKEAKKKKPEMTLKAWDALLKKERDQKFSVLRQRVKIQRDLIGKTNQLQEDLRTQAEEERIEKIQSLKHSRREVSSTHRQRVDKKTLMKKAPDTQALGECEPDSRTPCTEAPNVEVTPADSLCSEDISPRSKEAAHAAVMEIVGFENSKTIDTMWGGMKAKALRQISPVLKYSDQLKQVASPSVKQCLELYDQPAVRDRYTGKPIPLSDILMEASITRGHQLSAVNKSLQSLARNTQRKAQIMLDSKDTFTSCDPKFYLIDASTPIQKSRSAEVTESARVIVPKRCETSLGLKKQLPSYLTPDGDLVSGSLEEVGDQIYCAPSRNGKAKHYEHSSKHSSASPSSSDLSNTESRASLKSNWQPLSSNALTEYRKVTERSVSGLGHLAHGKYSMWKPGSGTVDYLNS